MKQWKKIYQIQIRNVITWHSKTQQKMVKKMSISKKKLLAKKKQTNKIDLVLCVLNSDSLIDSCLCNLFYLFYSRIFW